MDQQNNNDFLKSVDEEEKLETKKEGLKTRIDRITVIKLIFRILHLVIFVFITAVLFVSVFAGISYMSDFLIMFLIVIFTDVLFLINIINNRIFYKINNSSGFRIIKKIFIIFYILIDVIIFGLISIGIGLSGQMAWVIAWIIIFIIFLFNIFAMVTPSTISLPIKLKNK